MASQTERKLVVNPALTREDLITRIEQTEQKLEWAFNRIDTLTKQLNDKIDQINKLNYPPNSEWEPPF